MLGGKMRKRARPGPPAGTARLPRTSASHAGRPWRKSHAGVVGGGAAGFVLGAAFWVILGLQEIAGSGAPNLPPGWDPQAMPAPGCTSLALDRRQGHTTAEPCLRQALPLREARANGLGVHFAP